MKISVIGAGHVGKALALRWTETGHEVCVGVRDPESPKRNPLRAAGLKLLPIEESVRRSEVVVLAVPYASLKSVVMGLGDLEERVLVDCTNSVEVPQGFASIAQAVASWSRSSRVVKAFNTTGAGNMEDPRYGELLADMLICGDDQKSKDVVAKLARDIGFDVVDAGGLDKAKLLEYIALLWISLAYERDLGPNIAWKLLRR